MIWTGQLARRKGIRNVYTNFVGKFEGKRLYGLFRCRWEDNIRMDLREIVWIGCIWLRIGTSGGLM
jgi:hypothetical protein